MNVLYVVEVCIYTCDSYPVWNVISINRTFEGAVKALNDCGPQKWTEENIDEDYRCFKPDFVPNDDKHAPLESARIYVEELKN